MNSYKSFLVVPLLISSLSFVTVAAEDQSRHLDLNAPTMLPGSSTTVPTFYNDDAEEFGQQVPVKKEARESRPKWFHVAYDAFGSYQSNILFSEDSEIDDFLLQHSLYFGVTPILPDEWNRLSLELYTRAQLFQFAENDEVNFINQEIGINAEYALNDAWSVYGGFSASRLVDEDEQHEFFKYLNPKVGIRHVKSWTDQDETIAGLELDYRDTEPDQFSRVYPAVYFAWNHGFTERLHNVFFTRLEYSQYTNEHREDVYYLLSDALVYTVCENFNVRLLGSWIQNFSTQDGFDFKAGGLGVGLNVNYSF